MMNFVNIERTMLINLKVSLKKQKMVLNKRCLQPKICIKFINKFF